MILSPGRTGPAERPFGDITEVKWRLIELSAYSHIAAEAEHRMHGDVDTTAGLDERAEQLPVR